MGKKHFPFQIRKDTILKHVTEEEIFEYYLGTRLVFNRKFCSPLREDVNPTCSMSYTASGVLWMKDWKPGEFAGDCFNLVQHLYGGCEFREALLHIDKDMKLGLFGGPGIETRQLITKEEAEKKYKQKKSRAMLSIKSQPFNILDLQYWSSQGWTPELLSEYLVYSAKIVWLDGQRIWDYTRSNPIYAYMVNQRIKCYRPLEEDKERKWISNTMTTDIQGLSQLYAALKDGRCKGDTCIITKSMKDVGCLRNLGYWAIAPQSEENNLHPNLIDWLHKYFDKVAIFYDNDEPGMKKAKEESDKYQLPFMIVPHFMDAKDISELYESYGFDDAKDVMEINLKYV